jgi:ABC-type multidrug transport system fused ATPase/permease subunit
MNILQYLLEKFIKLQKWHMTGLTVLALVLSFFYTNISSKINANIIQSIQKNSTVNALLNFRYFILASIIFVVTFYFYKLVQNKLIIQLIHWVKTELFEFILKSNNENMSNMNFAEFITPISRIAYSCSLLLNDVLTNLIPTLGFLFVIFIYFFWKNWKLGVGFLIANIVIFVYLSFIWKSMIEYKQKQEELVVNNERYILDDLNNIEKVIYRGEIQNEIDIFKSRTDECVNYTVGMTVFMTNHVFIMNSMVYVIIFGCLYYAIQLHGAKKMDTITFITFITMLVMYRDNISDTIQSVPHNIDSLGRIDLISREFSEMVDSVGDIQSIIEKVSNYESVVLPFEKIVFKDVSFKYKKGENPVFNNYNKELFLQDKIIGITGLSGNGKSSFVKLLLRLHDCTGGTITIDGVDIKTINPFYIRENITYVNQSSKLFDRQVLENILYGCKDISKCNEYLKEILSYPKIQELYRNIELDTNAGPLGENLSGGQRQVANIISGLVNPTPIIILDEPTNALDPELKREILLLLQNFRKYKKCVIIITHDRDVYSLFDETLEL